MDSYTLSRKWFDYCFENPEKITPTHSAIYFFAIEHCNRLGWKKKFWFPTTMAMEALWIKSYNTYKKVLFELVDWGFIEMIEKSRNQYSANIIALSNFDKALNKALDKALIKHWTKHMSKQSESTVQSIVSINKQDNNITINKEQETIINKPKEKSLGLVKTFSEDSFEFNICRYFLEFHINEQTPSIIYSLKKETKESIINKWCDVIRKLKEIDKFTEKQIDFIIKYTLSDDFWKKQILSIEKFRKKKDGVSFFVKMVDIAKFNKQKLNPNKKVWVI